MRQLFIAFLIFTTAVPFAVAEPETYVIDSRHTFPSFEIDHIGYSIQRGRFNETSGKVVIDTANQTGSVNVTIKTASLDTGLAELEQELLKPEFFDPAKFPTIEYKSNRMLFKGEEPVGVEGLMTLHGQTKPLNLTIDSFKCGIHPINLKHVCGANVSGKMKRSDFGLTKYAPMLTDDVKISIQIEAFRQ